MRQVVGAVLEATAAEDLHLRQRREGVHLFIEGTRGHASGRTSNAAVFAGEPTAEQQLGDLEKGLNNNAVRCGSAFNQYGDCGVGAKQRPLAAVNKDLPGEFQYNPEHRIHANEVDVRAVLDPSFGKQSRNLPLYSGEYEGRRSAESALVEKP